VSKWQEKLNAEKHPFERVRLERDITEVMDVLVLIEDRLTKELESILLLETIPDSEESRVIDSIHIEIN